MKELFEYFWNMPMYQLGLIIAVPVILFLLIFAAFLYRFIQAWRKRTRRFNKMDADFEKARKRFQAKF